MIIHHEACTPLEVQALQRAAAATVVLPERVLHNEHVRRIVAQCITYCLHALSSARRFVVL